MATLAIAWAGSARAADRKGSILSIMGENAKGDAHGVYYFTLGPSFTDFAETNLFKAIPGAPAKVTGSGWSIGGTLASNGTWSYVATPLLAFGNTTEQDNGASLHRSFSLDILFAIGPDLARLAGIGPAVDGKFAFAIGPAVMPHIGPQYELTVPAGTMKVTSVTVPLAPSAVLQLFGESASFWTAIAWAPTKEFLFAQVNGIDSSPSLDEYRQKTAPADIGSRYDISVGGLRQRSVVQGTAGLAFGMLGIRADFRRTQFTLDGKDSGLYDQELRFSIGWGTGL